MWQMHRIIRVARECVTHSLTVSLPLRHRRRHGPPGVLHSSGEITGADAAGVRAVWKLLWDRPFVQEGPVCAAHLPAPLFV